MNKLIIVGEQKNSTSTKRFVYSTVGISPSVLASSHKDPIKILVEKDEKDE